MMFKAVTLAAALAGTASAHTHIWSAWVNGVDQGDGRTSYIRSPPNNNPVKDVTSPDIACNVNGGIAAPNFVSAAAGDKITFEWYHDNRGDDIIAASHEGPVQIYISQYDASPAGNGTGAIWSKIASQGYDATTKKWAVDNLIANKGKFDFTLPSELAPGQYLVRGEVIALHEADVAYTSNNIRGAQFYPGCVQFEVTGSGSATPPTDYDFQKQYTETDPGIVFNLYSTYSSYTAPGPNIWDGSSSGAAPVSSSSTAATSASAPAASSSAPAVPMSSSTAATPTTLATVVATPTSVAAPVTEPSDTSDAGDDDNTCDA